MYGLLNAHRSEQAAETGWVWRLANRQKYSIACTGFRLGGGVLFNETLLSYSPVRVGIGVLFFKAYKPVWRVRSHVCAR